MGGTAEVALKGQAARCPAVQCFCYAFGTLRVALQKGRSILLTEQALLPHNAEL